MADEHREDKPKRNWGAEIDGLRRDISELKAEIKKLATSKKHVKCSACKSGGFKLDKDGEKALDDDFDPIYCPVCKGVGSLKLD